MLVTAGKIERQNIITKIEFSAFVSGVPPTDAEIISKRKVQR